MDVQADAQEHQPPEQDGEDGGEQSLQKRHGFPGKNASERHHLTTRAIAFTALKKS